MTIRFNHLPVEPLRITSKFGKRNTGIQGASTYHKGIDLGRDFNKPETPILCVANGTVSSNYWNATRGWVVTVQHNGFVTLYQHLKHKSPLNKGTILKSGQQIGVMGASSTTIKNMATHLHFELIVGGTSADPEPYLKNITSPKEDDDLTRAETLKLIKEELVKSQDSASSWAKDSWKWGIENKLTDGTSPKGYCTREQLITILKRFCDLFNKK